MKIGIVTGEYPPLKGGVGDYTHAIAVNLTERGHNVRVITDQRCIHADNQSNHPIVRPIASSRWSWLDIWRVHVATTDLDIVNIQYQAAAFGSMRLPIHFLPRFIVPPSIVTLHDLRPPYLFPKAGRLRERAIWTLSQGAEGVIVTNQQDYNDCSARHGMPAIEQIQIGSNIPCAPPETFSASKWRLERGITPDELVLGYFGFLNADKGIETLLRALATLHSTDLNVRLILIGEHTGSTDRRNIVDAQRIDRIAKQLKIDNRILRTGYLAPTETSAALLSCDLMVMPYSDGVSFRRGSFLACLAHGRTTITTKPAFHISELIPLENVILTQPETTDIVNAVQTVYANPSLRRNVEEGALRLSKQFKWSSIAERLEAFFSDIISNHNA